MNINKIEKTSRILLIISFLSPLFGLISDLAVTTFTASPVPTLVGATPIIMGLYNIPFVIVSALFFVIGMSINYDKHLKLSGYLLLISAIISSVSILLMANWATGFIYLFS